MMTARFLRFLVIACVVAGVSYWLFADTVQHYRIRHGSGPLRISFWGNFQLYEMWKEMLASFRQKYPQIPVKSVYITDRYDAKIQQLLVADTAPDVISIQDEPFPHYVNSGQFEDLTPWLETPGLEIDLDGFFDTAVESFGRYEGEGDQRSWHMYGIPTEGGCDLVFYNRECFRRAGIRVSTVPGPEGLVQDPQTNGWILDDDRWTIDEFRQVCQLLTIDRDNDGRPEQFGFGLPQGVRWFAFHWSLGARILDPSRRHIALLGPESEASLQLWQDLRFKYRVSPTPAELGSKGGMAFYSGNIAMHSTGPWPLSKERGPWAKASLNADEVPFGVLHIPRGSPGGMRATRVSYNSLVMYTGSRKKPEAWKLIHHLVTSPQCQRIMARYQRSLGGQKSAQRYFEQYSSLPEVHKFGIAIADYARMQPITEHWMLMMREFDRAIEDLLHPDPKHRLSPAEVIGAYLSVAELTKVLPPLDPLAAECYREIYLGNVLLTRGQFTKALGHYQQALQIKPDWPAALNGIAWILATHPEEESRDPDEAIRLAELAAELSGYKRVLILETLAAAYAAAGDYERAVFTIQRALSAEPGDLEHHLRRRLDLYQRGMP